MKGTIQPKITQVANGGTGATTAEAARTNLGVYSQSEVNALEQSAQVLTVDCGTISALPVMLSTPGVTADMIVVESTLGTPSAQLSDWSVTTAANMTTIQGSISGSTTLVLYMVRPR